MAARLEATSTQGIYRRGSRYAVIYRDAEGRQRQESARTLDDARRLRARRVASVDDGSYQPRQRQKFAEYAREWIERYQGNGRRGLREDTREEYKRDLKRYGIPFLGRHRLEQITPRHVAEFIAWLVDEDEQGRRQAEARREEESARRGVPARTRPLKVDPITGRPPPHRLADGSVRRILAPVRSCLASALREDLIRHNPTVGAALPSRDEQHRIAHDEDDLDEQDQDVKALTTEQLTTLLAVAPGPRDRLLWNLLASTGVRIGEALALRWGDLAIDGEQIGDAVVFHEPAVRVRRSLRHGRFKPPKSRYGRRQVPIDSDLALELRSAHQLTEYPDERDLVFCGGDGKPLDYSNPLRAFKPAAQAAEAPWAAFHTLRHTCASRLFAAGRNAVQVQRWLGHHSPAFTLARYVHLLDGDLGAPLGLPKVPATVSAHHTESSGDEAISPLADTQQFRAVAH
jgi:integrase